MPVVGAQKFEPSAFHIHSEMSPLVSLGKYSYKIYNEVQYFDGDLGVYCHVCKSDRKYGVLKTAFG